MSEELVLRLWNADKILGDHGYTANDDPRNIRRAITDAIAALSAPQAETCEHGNWTKQTVYRDAACGKCGALRLDVDAAFRAAVWPEWPNAPVQETEQTQEDQREDFGDGKWGSVPPQSSECVIELRKLQQELIAGANAMRTQATQAGKYVSAIETLLKAASAPELDRRSASK